MMLTPDEVKWVNQCALRHAGGAASHVEAWGLPEYQPMKSKPCPKCSKPYGKCKCRK